MTALVINQGFQLPIDNGITANNPIIGYYNKLIDAAAITASSETATEPVSNLRNGATYLAWQADGAGDQQLDVDYGTAQSTDFFGLAVHNLGTTQASIQLQYSTNGTDYTAAGDVVTPNIDGVIFVRFEAVTARYWRLQITTASPTPVRVAVFYLGELLVLLRRIYVGHSPHTFGRKTSLAQGRSETGHFLGRVLKNQFLEHSIEQKNLPPEWARSYLLPFFNQAVLEPFFWAWRPQQYQYECGFGWFTDDPSTSNSGPAAMMQATFKVQSIT